MSGGESSGDSRRRLGAATRAVHSGERQDVPRQGPTVPIHLAAPFLFDTAEELIEAYRGPLRDKPAEERNTLYGRHGNPSVRAVETKLADLEGAEDAVAFSSGMAAISTTLATLTASGDRILVARELYGGTLSWLGWLGARHPEIHVERTPMAGLVSRLRDSTSRRPRVVYLETPANPLLTCVDLAAVCEAARSLDALVVVDNTFATPVLQNPLALGAHVVVHSATKFLAGHSDVIAGVAAGDAQTLADLRDARDVLGGCLDPHAAFLVSRGMRTLALRVERQSATAARLADVLYGHPKVSRVFYPGFDPQAGKQMRSGGAMVAFEIDGDVRAFLNRLRVIRILPSLGGVETGAIPPAYTSHRGLTAEERADLGIGENLVRLSVGIEDPDDLVDDLEQALTAP